MDFNKFVQSISPDMAESMKLAVETGRWPDGRKLTEEERETTLQAIIAYDFREKKTEDRVGYVKPKPKASKPSDEAKTLKWDE